MFSFSRRTKPPRITTEPHGPPRTRAPSSNGQVDRDTGGHDAFSNALARTQALLEFQIAKVSLEIQAGMGVQFNDLTETLRALIDPVCATLVARLHADADEIRRGFVAETAEAFIQQTTDRWESLTRNVTGLVEATARQALLAPVVGQMLALHDRILAEMTFQTALCRKLEATSLDTSVRTLHEQCEAAQRSYVAELLNNLAALGVQKIESRGGPLNPRHQRVLGVEPTTELDLDGHVAHVRRAGFLWNGAIHRPEDIIVYKLETRNAPQ